MDLDRERVEWRTLPDGGEALFVNLDAATGDGDGAYFACHNDELHAVGSLAPLIEGAIGLIAIKPDHTRQLVHVQPDPLAQEPDDYAAVYRTRRAARAAADIEQPFRGWGLPGGRPIIAEQCRCERVAWWRTRTGCGA